MSTGDKFLSVAVFGVFVGIGWLTLQARAEAQAERGTNPLQVWLVKTQVTQNGTSRGSFIRNRITEVRVYKFQSGRTMTCKATEWNFEPNSDGPDIVATTPLGEVPCGD